MNGDKMEAMKTKPALTKTQQEILELLKVPGEVVRRQYGGWYRLQNAARGFRPNDFNALWDAGFLKEINDGVWQLPTEESNRLAAERLADRNRRWWNTLRETAPIAIATNWDNLIDCDDEIKTRLAAVFDAIASEASSGEIPDLLKR